MRLPLFVLIVVSAMIATVTADMSTTGTKGATVTEAQFLKVMQTSCVRCHKVSSSVDTMVSQRWIVPGKPEISPVYTCLGKAKKKNLQNGRYHDVSPAAKAIIRDFVAQYKDANAAGQ